MFKIKKGVIILLLIACSVNSDPAAAATLHGTIYAWSDFENPLKNTVVEVNSTPTQYVVAKTGTYSFNLSPGNYLIRARYYRNNILEYSTEENIPIDKEGDFVRDLLLFPPADDEYEFLAEINLTSDIDNVETQNNYIYYVIAAIAVVSGSFAFYRFKKEKIGSDIKVLEPVSSENISDVKINELPEDLKELYDTILKMGGRVTQKELRKRNQCSEAKISLMITDLEDRGLIRKIKKGRSNIIIAEDQE